MSFVAVKTKKQKQSPRHTPSDKGSSIEYASSRTTAVHGYFSLPVELSILLVAIAEYLVTGSG